VGVGLGGEGGGGTLCLPTATDAAASALLQGERINRPSCTLNSFSQQWRSSTMSNPQCPSPASLELQRV